MDKSADVQIDLQLTSELADLGIDEVASPETDEIEREIKGLGLDDSDSDYADEEFDLDETTEPAVTESAAIGKLNLSINSKANLTASKRWASPKKGSGIVSSSSTQIGQIKRVHSDHHSNFALANPAISSVSSSKSSAKSSTIKATAAKVAKTAKAKSKSLLASPKAKWSAVKFEDIEMGPQIGGGGFALVYRARWNKKTVACKLLFDPNVDFKVKKEFMDELQVMAQLHHPNVVSLLAANDKPPKMFILMELCEDSLYTLLHGSKIPLSPRTCGGFMLDIALGLEHMHSRTPVVIHRDLKSQNVLVQGRTLKLCDFGLSGSRVATAGTPAYMAPELFAGRPFTKAVDVYAFAFLAWEIFAREIPYHGYSIADIKRMCQTNQRPACPSTEFPESIATLVTSAWDNSSSKRPSMREIVAILRPLVPTLWANTAAAVGADALDAMLNM